MKNPLKIKRRRLIQRKRRIRAKIFGEASKPRLSVFRSTKHIWVQIIDDTHGQTLVAASSRELKSKSKKTKREVAFLVGELIAKRSQEKGIEAVVFDRGGKKYHGRVAQVAEGARKGGLKF
ncbi:MAG: 50S ribosomal protein L18 [Parcubacteria group bacterium]|nr:50S ribosomal protein L18 [Parcubacteria group bacterium]